VINGTDPIWDWSLSPFSLLGGTLYMTWASSWFFSTAVLIWERNVQRAEAAQKAKVITSKVSADDLRALREARMQGQRGLSGG
jgi:hypothetical protein